ILPPGFIASFFIVEYQLIPFFGLLQFVGSLFAITMAIVAYKNGFRPARFFILSWTFVIFGAAIGMMTFTNLIEANFFTVHGFFFGALVELILLSIALADRLQHSEKLAISQAFTDPQTRQPNYSFFTSPFFTEQSVFKQNRPMAMMLLKLKGFRQLLGLLGPSGVERAYRLHISRIEEFLAHSEWALQFELPNSGKSHMVSLPGDHILIVAEVKDDYESIVIPLLHLAEKAIRIGKLESKLTFRIGVARFDGELLDVHECYRHAQLALLNSYTSQKEWFVYRPEDDAAFRSRLALLADLRQALENEELKIYIQPQFTAKDRALCGGEVLVRWTHPTKGMVSPVEFISLAEESNLIFKITKAVIHKSFEWLSYIAIDVNNFKLSINLSGLDIQHGELIPYVRWQLERSHVNPKQITFEVTESAVSDDRAAFLKVLNELKQLGFTIAIDDFGTGYSSMQYMQQINADIIKVDMSFIRNIHQSEINQKIVDAIIRVANATGAYIVAEGVEVEEELAVLKTLGAQNIQGYLFGEPVPAVVFERRYLNTIESGH
ncbi:MAG: EAL domain-containing protein, partial [Kangiellaceae bacterium]|nr:EAL domain-containing protein [Kangiellaceae bacterium]